MTRVAAFLMILLATSAALAGPRRGYAKFEDVPADAYDVTQLRGHYGDIRAVELRRDVTIAGVPCAAGMLELETTTPGDRCDEAESEADARACRRSHARRVAAFRRRAGISSTGYIVRRCTLATDARVRGIQIDGGSQLELGLDGRPVRYTRPDGVEVTVPRR